VQDAVRLGRLSQDQAREHVQALEYKQTANIGLLVNQSVEGANRKHAMDFVAKLKEMLYPDQTVLDAARDEAKRYCEEHDQEMAKHRAMRKGTA
jgi:hypothetical protein